MSGPVTTIPTQLGGFVALWRYALAHTVSTKKLAASLRASGYLVFDVAGEPQVRVSDIEEFIKKQQMQALQAQIHRSDRADANQKNSEPKFTPSDTEQRLLDQAREVELLKQKVEQLLAAQGGVA